MSIHLLGSEVDHVSGVRQSAPMLTIRTVNSKLAADTEVEAISTVEEALTMGVRGAVAMVTEDISQGKPAGSVTVTVLEGDKPTAAVVVTLSVAPLFVEAAPA